MPGIGFGGYPTKTLTFTLAPQLPPHTPLTKRDYSRVFLVKYSPCHKIFSEPDTLGASPEDWLQIFALSNIWSGHFFYGGGGVEL